MIPVIRNRNFGAETIFAFVIFLVFYIIVNRFPIIGQYGLSDRNIHLCMISRNQTSFFRIRGSLYCHSRIAVLETAFIESKIGKLWKHWYIVGRGRFLTERSFIVIFYSYFYSSGLWYVGGIDLFLQQSCLCMLYFIFPSLRYGHLYFILSLINMSVS